MKVSEFMNRSVLSLEQDNPAIRAIKIIYNVGIKAVPIVKNKKLVGILTEEDILKNLFPSIKEFMEDSRVRDFDAMEENLLRLLNQPIKKIMSADVRFVTESTPLMKAQSMMVLHNFSHLPVVDETKQLIGMISQGDIFRAIVGSEVPFDDNEEFHEWSSRFHDSLVSMENRLEVEIDALHQFFQKYHSHTILDVFCGAGQHDIALAKKGYEVFGINTYELFHKKAAENYKNLPENLQKRLAFMRGNYEDVLHDKSASFDAVIMTGNALAHHPETYPNLLKLIDKCLVQKNAFLFLQIANFEKILKDQNRLQNFTISKSKLSEHVEYAFLEYYDPPRKGLDNLTLTISVQSYQRNRWKQIGINSTPIAYITKEKIGKLLKQNNFNKISFYGSTFLKNPLKEEFDIHKHDWLNVVATR